MTRGRGKNQKSREGLGGVVHLEPSNKDVRGRGDGEERRAKRKQMIAVKKRKCVAPGDPVKGSRHERDGVHPWQLLGLSKRLQ